jgi:hypothetical protein
MCNAWTIDCDCCNEFQYLHTFKHCIEETCVIVHFKRILQSFCDLCEKNNCRGQSSKCVETKLELNYTKLKTADQINFHKGGNIKKRSV